MPGAAMLAAAAATIVGATVSLTAQPQQAGSVQIGGTERLDPRYKPMPPSLPPADGIHHEDVLQMPASNLTNYTYEWRAGFIGSGGDVVPPASVSLSEAKARCDTMARCRGITYHGDNRSAGENKVYFKMDSGVEDSDGWSSWVKVAKIEPPIANISVGGSSNLQLLLRKDFYTVQNLSRRGELWSFTRPLDDKSALPMSALLGDMTIRLRSVGDATAADADASAKSMKPDSTAPLQWDLFSTLGLGAPATPIELPEAAHNEDMKPSANTVLAAQDITALLASSNSHALFPLRVTRAYERSADGQALVIRFNVTHAPSDGRSASRSGEIEIGGLGFALPESEGHPPAGIETVVWCDPHLGMHHGFVEFVRVVDDEATLLVTSADRSTTLFEAWRPQLEDMGNGDSYEWTVASTAWADEWARSVQTPHTALSPTLTHTYPPFASTPADKQTPWPATDGKNTMPPLSGGAKPWNHPSSFRLAVGQSRSFALRLQLSGAGGPRQRDATLSRMGNAVAHSVPGFVVSSDMRSAKLFVTPPGNLDVLDARPEEVDNGAVLLLTRIAPSSSSSSSSSPPPSPQPPSSSWAPTKPHAAWSLTASGVGRVRVIITFTDQTTAVVHYYLLPPLQAQVDRLGHFLEHSAWLPRDYPDPFGRSASVMPWDRSSCEAEDVSPGLKFVQQQRAKASPTTTSASSSSQLPSPSSSSSPSPSSSPSSSFSSPEAPSPCGHVLSDARAYDVGLSDDAGGGGPLCLASKVRARPTQPHADLIDEYISSTLYGVKPDVASPPLRSLQIREDEPGDVDGVRMTMFYYDEHLSSNSSGHFEYNYTEADKCHKPFGSPVWCMTENMANATYRGFNYPHQIASYWAMYHVARNTRLRTRRSWQWYLTRAARTSLKLNRASVGFMDGTVAREVLEALKAEAKIEREINAKVERLAGKQEEESAPNRAAGIHDMNKIDQSGVAATDAVTSSLTPPASFASYAKTLEDNMRARQQHWANTPYPYGSEFGFDTTGQEEVVVWNLYFGNVSVAKQTVDHILSYMRNSPTWAYHGGARSWGDVGNNGKYLATFGTGAKDRGQMHYRSGLNMIPLIEWYRAFPDEIFVLEIAMGAITGQMANVDAATGAPSMMFHAVPHMLEFDPHSGDFGLGFFGNALESGSYYVEHPQFGQLCFLCDLVGGADTSGEATSSLPMVRLAPRDAYRTSVFLEPIALFAQAECGTISAVEFVKHARTVSIWFDEKSAEICDVLRLKVTKTSTQRGASRFRVTTRAAGALVPLRKVRGAFVAPLLDNGGTEIVITYSTLAEHGDQLPRATPTLNLSEF